MTTKVKKDKKKKLKDKNKLVSTIVVNVNSNNKKKIRQVKKEPQANQSQPIVITNTPQPSYYPPYQQQIQPQQLVQNEIGIGIHHRLDGLQTRIETLLNEEEHNRTKYLKDIKDRDDTIRMLNEQQFQRNVPTEQKPENQEKPPSNLDFERISTLPRSSRFAYDRYTKQSPQSTAPAKSFNSPKQASIYSKTENLLTDKKQDTENQNNDFQQLLANPPQNSYLENDESTVTDPSLFSHNDKSFNTEISSYIESPKTPEKSSYISNISQTPQTPLTPEMSSHTKTYLENLKSIPFSNDDLLDKNIKFQRLTELKYDLDFKNNTLYKIKSKSITNIYDNEDEHLELIYLKGGNKASGSTISRVYKKYITDKKNN